MKKPEHPRLQREYKTIGIMTELYCHDMHGKESELCPSCQALLDYAGSRLEKCPFQEEKTTCAKCPVHCYKPDMRQQVREVMRYAGPRMLTRHPILAILHLLDGLKRSPAKSQAKAEQKG